MPWFTSTTIVLCFLLVGDGGVRFFVWRWLGSDDSLFVWLCVCSLTIWFCSLEKRISGFFVYSVYHRSLSLVRVGLWSIDTSKNRCVTVSDMRWCPTLVWDPYDTCRKSQRSVTKIRQMSTKKNIYFFISRLFESMIDTVWHS